MVHLHEFALCMYEYKEMDLKCAKSEMCQIKSLNIGVQTSWRL